jgi:murein DD-endopeptidase MepM/ murein hydrolase activator NlpD
VLVLALSALGPTFAVASSPGTAAASIRSDRTKLSQIEKRIASQGELVQTLVSRYDRVEGQMEVIQGGIARDHIQLVVDHRADTAATIRLRQVAIDAYVNAASGLPTLFGSASATTMDEQGVYLGVASGSLDAAVTTLQFDEHRTSTTESALRSEQARIAATLRQLASADEAAQHAIEADKVILSHVSANLLALVIAANERHEAAEEEAQERVMAAAAAQKAANTPPPPPPTTTPPTTTSPATTPTTTTPQSPPPPPPPPPPGIYANPLRAVGDLVPERVDQGVDYSGSGPIYAVGDGVVLSTVNGGWPGGTFIAYRLTDGAANGLVVYAAEDIDPAVQVGETVGPSTVLGQVYEGPDGIETGWADPSALGLTMAAASGQFDGSNSTAFGYNFSQLLVSLGAPGGILQNNPPTGSVPQGWPTW